MPPAQPKPPPEYGDPVMPDPNQGGVTVRPFRCKMELRAGRFAATPPIPGLVAARWKTTLTCPRWVPDLVVSGSLSTWRAIDDVPIASNKVAICQDTHLCEAAGITYLNLQRTYWLQACWYGGGFDPSTRETILVYYDCAGVLFFVDYTGRFVPIVPFPS